MNVPLLVAGILSILVAIAHSALGEWLLLRPLFRHGDVTKLLGSRRFARRTLRFAWHVTSVLLVAIGVVVAMVATMPLEAQTVWILRVLSVTFAACSVVSLIGSRGKHFSWWVFLIIALLIWLGARPEFIA